MQLKFRLMPAVVLALLTVFTACKKDDAPPVNPGIELTEHADDQNRVSAELDAVANEVNAALESDASFSGRGQDITDIANICGATAVADTTGPTKSITITYNGNNCFGTHHRTGTVVLSMPSGVHWKDAGAAIELTITDLKIKRLSDDKSITLNGSQTYTNVTGGLLFQLANMNEIIHTTSSDDMSVKFDDNTEHLWNIERKRTFTYDGGIVLSVTGNHTSGNNSNIAEWGINRFGNPFTTSINNAITIRQDCLFRITEGKLTHELNSASASVTFGLDNNGNSTTCPASGPFYYKLAWTGPNGGTGSVMIPY